jgi:hypothetical protein
LERRKEREREREKERKKKERKIERERERERKTDNKFPTLRVTLFTLFTFLRRREGQNRHFPY